MDDQFNTPPGDETRTEITRPEDEGTQPAEHSPAPDQPPVGATSWAAPGIDPAEGSTSRSELEEIGSAGTVATAKVPRNAGLRWGVAFLIIALTVAAVAAGAFVLSTRSTGSSPLAGYVPAGTIAYLEARTDLAGDQARNAAAILARFPGFKDQANLSAKIDEALDQLFSRSSIPGLSYTKDVKPWFGGDLAFAVPAVAKPADSAGQRALFLFSVKDEALAKTELNNILGVRSTGAEDYRGVHLMMGKAATGPEIAVGISGRTGFAGDTASVKAAIDTQGSSPFAQQGAFADAQKNLPDHVAFGFLDFKQLMDAALQASGGSTSPGIEALVSKVPPWVAFTARVESDSFVTEFFGPIPSGGLTGTARESTLDHRLPPQTLLAAETRDVGQVIKNAIDSYKLNSATKDAADQVDQALTSLGGVAWLGDATIALERDGTNVNGGLVVEAKDAPAADRELTQLKNLVSLGGGTAIDEPYGDGTITVLDFGDLSQLTQALGQATGQTNTLPFPVNGRAQLAFTVQRGLVVLAPGDTFIKAVVDAKDGSSLADQPAYKSAIDRAGAKNFGQAYWNLAGTLDLAESMLPDSTRSSFDTSIKPYLAPFDAFVIGGTSSGDRFSSRFIVSFK